MILELNAACGSSKGYIRENNEDNFYFNGRGLALSNGGMAGTTAAKFSLTGECCFGVFDGMGGEEYGEVAAFAAVQTLKEKMAALAEYVASPRPFLEDACAAMNLAVCREAEKLGAGQIGTTAAVLMFIPDEVYVCNIGDSRIYRLRGNQLMQLSRDHVQRLPSDTQLSGKPLLTQCLGMDPAELRLEPYIAKGSLRKEDIYLICSDGLTDMLSNLEIFNCLRECGGVRQAAEQLLREALKKGGRDNITVIVIKVQ